MSSTHTLVSECVTQHVCAQIWIPDCPPRHLCVLPAHRPSLSSADEALEVGQGLFGQELRGVLNFCMHDQWG